MIHLRFKGFYIAFEQIKHKIALLIQRNSFKTELVNRMWFKIMSVVNVSSELKVTGSETER